MIGALGFLAINGAFALTGLAILYALGWISWTVREALPSLGLAFLTGVAALLIVGIALVVIGAGFSIPLFFGSALVIGCAALYLGRRRNATVDGSSEDKHPVRDPRPKIETFLMLGLVAGLAGWLVLVGTDSAVHPLNYSDGWAIWANKGVMLSKFSGVPPTFTSDAYTYMHRDYPILLPLLESVMFRGIGTINTQLVHLELWLLLVAFCGSIAFLARRLVSPIVWVLLAFAVAFAPGIWGQLQTGYADVPMAFFLCIGVLLLGFWVAERETSQLALATLFLAAAASTKNEGLIGAVCAFGAAGLVVVAGREWPTLKRLAFAAGGFVLMLLPWRLWMAAENISSDLPLGKGLDPTYVLDRADRIWPSMKAFEHQLVDVARWSYLVPLGLGLIAVALYERYRSGAPATASRIAVYYLVTGIGFFLAITWAYTITTDPLSWQIDTSASRIVTGVVLISVAAIAHLSGMLASDSAEEPERARQDSNL